MYLGVCKVKQFTKLKLGCTSCCKQLCLLVFETYSSQLRVSHTFSNQSGHICMRSFILFISLFRCFCRSKKKFKRKIFIQKIYTLTTNCHSQSGKIGASHCFFRRIWRCFRDFQAMNSTKSELKNIWITACQRWMSLKRQLGRLFSAHCEDLKNDFFEKFSFWNF